MHWEVSRGTQIRVWHDNWLLGGSQATPVGPGMFIHPDLRVKDLFIAGSSSWNQPLLQQLFQHEDVQRIMRLRPSITGGNDVLYWRLSNSRKYIVKSGYHVQKQMDDEDALINQDGEYGIWKMRNKLLFENTRVHIVQVIKKAIMDLNLLKEALQLNEPVSSDSKENHYHSIEDILPREPCFYCIVDASWKSPYETACIGWSLYSPQGTLIIQGSSAITPTNSSLEAEAMATLLAVQQLHRLRYDNVMFLGDNAQLYKSLQDSNHFCNEATTMVMDISNLSKLNKYSFKKVPRNLVHYVDLLAKRDRLMNQQYVISWLSS
ncbi:Ribonuclease H-like domain protein [Raphanus sativus]|nr:Ribonuclease H-like domain protein [Raphanus sativus]